MVIAEELRAERDKINQQIDELRAKAFEISAAIYEIEKDPLKASKGDHSMMFIVQKSKDD